jgi:predicted transposase YbfD/YdcC
VTETQEKSRGRVEIRRLSTCTLSNAQLSWPGVQQALKLERITWRKGREVRSVTYALTSVSRLRASTADLLSWLRGRWGIENTGFWVRDVTFGEDHCRIRSGTSADAFSRVRNAAMNAIKAWGGQNVAGMLREHAFRSDLLFTRVGIINQ